MGDKYNLVVIGAGPGGYVAAIKAAQNGMRVALVEQDKVGGTCLNRGCIPTKAMLHTAHLYRELQHAAQLGITVQGLGLNEQQMHERTEEVMQKLRDGVEFLLKANKVELVRGKAFIPAPGSVQVENGEERTTLETEKILVATGGEPALPPIKGIRQPRVFTSDDLPVYMGERLVIIGGGVIGVEYATLYSSFGIKVIIIEAADQLLPTMDREVGQNLAMILKKRGVEIYTGATVQSLEDEHMNAGSGVFCFFTHKGKEMQILATDVLVATGRRPVWEGLFAQGCQPKAAKGIIVNEHFETSVDGIYAIGDVVEGSIQLAHAASAQGICAVEAMLGKSASIDLAVVPGCVYTDPEIACVGITADEAKAAGIPVKTGKFAMAGLGRSVIEYSERGFIKLVFHEETEKLLGAQLMCHRATDLVSELATAIVNGLTAQQLAQVIRPHPTFVEGITEAAEDVWNSAVHVAPRRKL